MIKLDTTGRWEKERLSALFSENNIRNTNFIEKKAYQFFFGTITPKKEFELTDDLIEIYSKYTVIKPGDIIINGLNLNYDFVTQRVGIARENGIITSAYISLRPRTNLNPNYYCYLLKTVDAQKMFHGLGTGIRLTLSFKDIKYLLLPVPPRDEQDQIVRFLDWKVSSINRLIDKYRHEIALLKQLKQKHIDIVITQGLRNSSLLKSKDNCWNINYPEHWQIHRLKEYFSFRKGLSITKDDLEETGIAVISYGQIHSKKNNGVGLNEELIKHVNEQYLNMNPSCLVEQGDFIFADTSEDIAGCGNYAYIDWKDTIFAGYHTIIAHPNSKTNSKYLAYLFMSPSWRYQIQRKVNGVKVYSITQKLLKDTFILVPPVNEQEEIVNYLDILCKQTKVLTENLEKKISNLQDLKVRLISDTVTGKIDVRGVKIPEYEFVDETADPENAGDETDEQED